MQTFIREGELEFTEPAITPQVDWTDRRITMPEKLGFRPGTTSLTHKMGLLFINGGLGDFICWMQAIRYLDQECPWIEGIVIAPRWFHELVQHWLGHREDWAVADYQTFMYESDVKRMHFPETFPLRGKGAELSPLGSHLIDCGFAKFASLCPPPAEWNYYPPLEILDAHLPTQILSHEKPFAVVCLDGAQKVRSVPSEYWIPILEHLRAKGITPVFLGKTKMYEHPIVSKFDGRINPKEWGIDLRNKTTLLQAAAVMEHAEVVIGLDNGLLHLAGCTRTPIVFGYNMTSIEHRRPRRKVGRIVDVTLTKEELSCIGCQSKFNSFVAHNYQECFYKDLACVAKLFENAGRRWIEAIDQILGL